ncbi:hypothetical protein L1987_76872 [Smallanthus sonchifolius]|uniref:Uncharacterized protein n=1 Tax=Smallanthus sonchifolius TaxID=185202 RepID=A0ACB8Z804_9ASTR|nr:hypothetical protein L1987_76872 [Smallanthus sonchifolius]
MCHRVKIKSAESKGMSYCHSCCFAALFLQFLRIQRVVELARTMILAHTNHFKPPTILYSRVARINRVF